MEAVQNWVHKLLREQFLQYPYIRLKNLVCKYEIGSIAPVFTEIYLGIV